MFSLFLLKEKDKRKEEIKQLKNMKKQEIMDKIDKLKEIAGNQSLDMNTEDLEGDFDPDKHDQMMKVSLNTEDLEGDFDPDKHDQMMKLLGLQ